MEIIWVLENVTKQISFYNKLRILLLVASVSLWKKYHPNHITVLYCDNLTLDTLDKLNILHLWNDIRKLNSNVNIRKTSFWSTCKTEIISKTKIPICIVDHDFLIFKNIDEHLNNKVLYTYDEITNSWYYIDNKLNKKLTKPITKIIDKAANVSLFYLPDYKFANEYAKQVLQNHIEFTKLGADCTNYMVLSEQMLLKQWLIERNIPHNTLSNYLWDCNKIKPSKLLNDRGIWNYKESNLYYKHYGMEKRRKVDLDYLIRCINSGGIKVNKNDKWLLNFK